LLFHVSLSAPRVFFSENAGRVPGHTRSASLHRFAILCNAAQKCLTPMRLKWQQPVYKPPGQFKFRPPRRLARHVHDTGHAQLNPPRGHTSLQSVPWSEITQEPVKDTRNGTGLRGALCVVRRTRRTMEFGARRSRRPLVHFAAHVYRSVSRTVKCRVTRFRLLFVCCVCKQFFPSFTLFGEVIYFVHLDDSALRAS